MTRPLVSVVIPAFNQAHLLGAAIQSVLGQSYRNLELIVVNDASPDETSAVARGFSDSRVRLIEHDRNRGLPAARNTGIRAAGGDLIALLDADDFYHPDKLASHVEFLDHHKNVDVTYNARFNLHHSSLAVRNVWRPPLEVGLAAFVLGWPFAPSDMVVRREPLFRVGLFDEGLFSGGEDVDLPCRLALAGCTCASVNRALNYRRYHSRRRKRNLPARWQDYRVALDAAFDDPRCPPAVRALRAEAYTKHYLELVYLSFAQGERDLGQTYVREAVRLDPHLLVGEPCALMRHLLEASIADESLDHKETLGEILAQMPPECDGLERQYEWAVRHGWLLKATGAAIWAAEGTEVGAVPEDAWTSGDDAYVAWAASQLDSYEIEFGPGSADVRAQNISRALKAAGARRRASQLAGRYLVNQAFRRYRAGTTDAVPRVVVRAMLADPKYVANRGVLSILLRSALAAPGRATPLS